VKFRIFAAAFAIAFAATGCSKVQEHRFKEQAIGWVKERMNDPASAQFEGLEVLWREDKQIILCGRINAKNRMGGYVGFVPFFVVGDLGNGRPSNLRGDFAPTTMIDREDELAFRSFVTRYESHCGPIP